jgi:hypothetical protein
MQCCIYPVVIICSRIDIMLFPMLNDLYFYVGTFRSMCADGGFLHDESPVLRDTIKGTHCSNGECREQIYTMASFYLRTLFIRTRFVINESHVSVCVG